MDENGMLTPSELGGSSAAAAGWRRDARATGFWVGKGDRARLNWRIEGEFVSDRALRSWCYQNMDGIGQHVGPCILKMHVNAYANRSRNQPAAAAEGASPEDVKGN